MIKLCFAIFFHYVLLVFAVDRIDADGWETVQRGRPIRSRFSAITIKSCSPSAAEHKVKDDSDKENICSKSLIGAPEDTAKSELPPLLVEPPAKELLCPCEIPLTEITQVEAVCNGYFSKL